MRKGRSSKSSAGEPLAALPDTGFYIPLLGPAGHAATSSWGSTRPRLMTRFCTRRHGPKHAAAADTPRDAMRMRHRVTERQRRCHSPAAGAVRAAPLAASDRIRYEGEKSGGGGGGGTPMNTMAGDTLRAAANRERMRAAAIPWNISTNSAPVPPPPPRH